MSLTASVTESRNRSSEALEHGTEGIGIHGHDRGRGGGGDCRRSGICGRRTGILELGDEEAGEGVGGFAGDALAALGGFANEGAPRAIETPEGRLRGGDLVVPVLVLVVAHVRGDEQAERQQLPPSAHPRAVHRLRHRRPPPSSSSSSSLARAADPRPAGRFNISAPYAPADARRASTAAAVVTFEPSTDHHEDAIFNPLRALQCIYAGDSVALKLRAKAAMQLAAYIHQLPRTPGLYVAYEPYLPMLADVVVVAATAGKASRELQENTLALLKALGAHAPRQFVGWARQYASLHPGVLPPWHVDWCLGLVFQAEARVPRRASVVARSNYEGDNAEARTDGTHWNEQSTEFVELEASMALLFQMWRSMLETTDSEATVAEIVRSISMMHMRDVPALQREWIAMLTAKLQPHFVTMADVLIGWSTSSITQEHVRFAILSLLMDLQPLWKGNSVFSLQLLESFSRDIASLHTSIPASDDEWVKLDSIMTCFVMVAKFFPEQALTARQGSSPFGRAIEALATNVASTHSSYCISRCCASFDFLFNSHRELMQPYSIQVVRFLLLFAAVQISNRSDFTSILKLLELAALISHQSFPSVKHSLDIEHCVSAIMSDKVHFRSQLRTSENVVTILLQARSLELTKFVTRTYVQLLSIRSENGLLNVADKMLTALTSSNATIAAFWGTCFVLLCQSTLESSSLNVILESLQTVILRSIRVFRSSLCCREDLRIRSILSQVSASFVKLVTTINYSKKDQITEALTNEVIEMVQSRCGSSDFNLESVYSHLKCCPSGMQITQASVTKLLGSVKRSFSSGDRRRHKAASLVLRYLMRVNLTDCDQKRVIRVCEDYCDSMPPSDAVRVLVSMTTRCTSRSSAVRPHLFAFVDQWSYAWSPSVITSSDVERVFTMICENCSDNDWDTVATDALRGVPQRIQSMPMFDGRLGKAKLLVNEVSKWIVHNRLRSHFGQPSQTFSSIEQTMIAVVERAREHEFSRSGFLSLMMTAELFLSMEVFINIVSDSRTIDGNTESDAHKIQSFFRANIGVCDEWLSRTRPIAIEILRKFGHSESLRSQLIITVQHLARKVETQLSRLQRLDDGDDAIQCAFNTTVELERSLFDLSVSFSNYREVDSIVGYRIWGASMFRCVHKRLEASGSSTLGTSTGEIGVGSTAATWLHALQVEAEGKLEDAARMYQALVSAIMGQYVKCERLARPLFHPMGSFGISISVFVRLIHRLGCCYVALRNWNQLGALQERTERFFNQKQHTVEWRFAERDIVDLLAVWKSDSVWSDALSSPSSASVLEKLPIRAPDNCALGILGKWSLFGDIDKWVLHGMAGRTETSALREQRFALDLRSHLISSSGVLSSFPSPPPVAFTQNIARIIMHDILSSKSMSGTHTLPILSCSIHDPTLWARLVDARLNIELSQDDRILCVKMLVQLARQARKLNNAEFARTLLSKSENLMSSNLNVLSPQAAYELALLHDENDSQRFLKIVGLCKRIVTSLKQNHASITTANETPGHVRAFVRLGKLIVGDHVSNHFESIQEMLAASTSLRSEAAAEFPNNPSLDSRLLAAQCFAVATIIDPQSPKAWLQYSKWCHHRGREVIDCIIRNRGSAELLVDEKRYFDSILGQVENTIDDDDRSSIELMVCQVMDEDSFVRNRENRLRVKLRFLKCSDQCVADLVEFQTQVVCRILEPLRLAAKGYSAYLSTATNTQSSHDTQRTTSRMTSVALRLLRILTRFGVESAIHDVAMQAFANGPLIAWTRVVPQLLSRVAHPDADVSRAVCVLLKRLARHQPHLVVFPTIVESKRESLKTGESMATILDEIRMDSIELVNEVQLVVKELNRIAILWDDAWIAGLIKISTDATRRISTLEKEAQRVKKNESLTEAGKMDLSRRKSIAIMKPVLLSLEKLWSETVGAATPMSSHERSFVQVYGTRLSQAINSLRIYCDANKSSTPGFGQDSSRTLNPNISVTSVWAPFAEILKDLVDSVGRRDRIRLDDISPLLAAISEHEGPLVGVMPGTSSCSSDHPFVKIKEVNRVITVLRTKTKPKCLTFLGSNGESYRYLLKAREDLHLDERMMQFLSTVNDMLSADRSTSVRCLSARNYSVVPISSDAGLIQMVPDVVPLFQIHTSRLDDASTNALALESAPFNVADMERHTNPPQPPTVAFYAKLRQYGISDVGSNQRSLWPIPVLRRVYEELASSQPRNILYREILSHSRDFGDCSLKMARLSRSLAVMSVLGYVIGLGDRHLDNILLCCQTGDIVHIDYNVCFDKGRRLKVPEIVPFRMTPILADSLGITGVEGTFRIAFEQTLRVIRDADSREALVSLLEAFVYDPLLEWVINSRDHHTEETRRRLELNVNLSLFLSRAEEQREDLKKFDQTFARSAGQLRKSLEAVQSSALQPVLDQFASLKEARDMAKVYFGQAETLEREIVQAMALPPGDDGLSRDIKSRLSSLQLKVLKLEESCSHASDGTAQLKQQTKDITLTAGDRLLHRMKTAVPFPAILDRITSTVANLPPCPSIPIWNITLGNLKERSRIIDNTLHKLTGKLEGLFKQVLPSVEAYSNVCNIICSDVGNSDHNGHLNNPYLYLSWAQWCKRILSAINNNNNLIHLGSILSGVAVPSYVSSHDEDQLTEALRIIQMKRRAIADMGSDIGIEISQEVKASIDEFVDGILCMKLSNAQTQNILKLASYKWVTEVFRSPEGWASKPLPSTPICLLNSARAVALMLDLIATPKGSLKKLSTASLFGDHNDTRPAKSGPSVLMLNGFMEVVSQVTVLSHTIDDASVLVANRVFSGFSLLVAKMRETQQLDEVQKCRDMDQLSRRAVDDVCKLIAYLENFSSLCKVFGVDCCAKTAPQKWTNTFVCVVEAIEKSRGAIGLLECDPLSMIADTVQSTLVEPLNSIMTYVTTMEWKFNGVDVSMDESEALLEILPSLGHPANERLALFQKISNSLFDVVDKCQQVWTERVSQSSHDHETLFLTKLEEDIKKSLMLTRWRSIKSNSNLVNRQGVVLAFEATSQSLLQKDADLDQLGSMMLEVAQQLEYLLSQVTFSFDSGITIEIQGLSVDVQSSYSRFSDLSNFTQSLRTVIEMALEVENLMVDIDEIGKVLAVEVREIVPRLSDARAIEEDDHTQQLKSKLEHTYACAKAAENRSKNVEAQVVESVNSVGIPVEAIIRSVVEASNSLLEILTAFEKTKKEFAPTSTKLSSKKSRDMISGRKDLSGHPSTQSREFSFTEHERLLKILRRSVKSADFTHELNAVLQESDSTLGLLHRTIPVLTETLAGFSRSATMGLNDNNPVRYLSALNTLLSRLAVPEALTPYHSANNSSDILSLSQSLVSSSCGQFFEAARIADELTTADTTARGSADSEYAINNHDDHNTNSNGGLQPAADLDVVDHVMRENEQSSQQEKNRTGLEVIRHVEDKLNGVVGNTLEHLSVQEQANWLIREATNIDNLCVMYEGWTPWI